MRNKILIFSFLVLTAGSFSGCAALLIGGAAGYEVSGDSAKANIDVSYDKAYDLSLETMRDMGGLNVDRNTDGWIKFESNHCNVAIHIEKLTEATVRITVSAREYSMPKSQYARDILAKILKKIKHLPFWM